MLVEINGLVEYVDENSPPELLWKALMAFKKQDEKKEWDGAFWKQMYCELEIEFNTYKELGE